jgi:NAD(P)-dependent dehydrogenase (short-subunit alcohol dehydrogenase family)
MLPEKSLEGRVAVITGGGTGIGLGIAREYARLAAKLVLASRSAEHLDLLGSVALMGQALPKIGF